MRFAPVVGLLLTLLFVGMSWGQRARNLSFQWERAEFALFDATVRLRGPRPVGDHALVIGIDDDTIRRHPDIYETRDGVASLVGALHAQGAKAVAVDFMMENAERRLPGELPERVAAWHDTPEAETPPLATQLLEEIFEANQGDAHLAAAMRAKRPDGKKGRTILGFHIGDKGAPDIDDRALTRGTYGQVVAGEHLGAGNSRGVTSYAPLNKAAKRLGVLGVSGDGDTVTRQVPVAIRTTQRHFIPMGVQLAAEVLGVNRALTVYRGDLDALELGDLQIHADRGAFWLNWRGKNAFPQLPAWKVLDGSVAEQVEGRVTVIAMLNVAEDLARTPFGDQSGVQSHLTLMDNILHEDPLVRTGGTTDALFTLGVCLAVLVPFLLPGLRLYHMSGMAIAAVVSFVLPYQLLATSDLWLGSIGAKLGVVFVATGCMVTAWAQEGAEARAMRGAFSRYISDDLMKVISDDPTLVSLQGQRRELSILFSDIRDFTSHSERMDPLELVAFLNNYLEPMTKAVMSNRGFVDKFIGDAVMALFGAPVPDEHHAVQACRAALDMSIALAAIRPMAAEHGIDLAIGVGVNSGEVALGNLGSGDRFEYTVLGDAVNLSARLEGLTKNYGVFCLIGPRTAGALTDEFGVRSVDLVRVKGKDEPVEIYELMRDDRVTVVEYADLDVWDRGIALWRSGDFPGAREAFAQFQSSNPKDPAVALYLSRLASRPDAPADWDGVFTHTKK